MIDTLTFPTLLKFPLGGAQQELERVSRMFSGAFRRPFQSAFTSPDAAAAALFVPTDAPGLKLWYKPRDLVLSDGVVISTLPDFSGNAWDATGSADRPVCKTNIINGLAIARNDGSQFLTVDSGALGILQNIGSATIVVVAAPAVVWETERSLFGGTTNDGFTRLFVGANSTAAKLFMGGRRLDADSVERASGAASLSADTFYIIAFQFDYANATIKAWLNGGSADISTAFQTAGNTQNLASTFIKFSASAGAPWLGDQGDTLVYVSKLSLANLNLLGAYLATTYALTWTTAI